MDLTEILTQVLGAPVALHDSARNDYQSTFDSRIVACEADGERLEVLIKSGPTGSGSGHGHRGGVTREVEAYRELLAPFGLGPRFIGAVENGGSTWLVLEYLANAMRLGKSEERFLVAAARWVGKFHARYEDARPPCLPVYDREYYLGWARRARALWPQPDVERVCDRFEGSLDALLAVPQTVIHGEFTPKNILVDGESICPVDWESAAVGPGEVDLYVLLDGWEGPWRSDAIRGYREARYPTGIPAQHEAAFEAADLYWVLRWLGEEEYWRTKPDPPAQVATLLAAHNLARGT